MLKFTSHCIRLQRYPSHQTRNLTKIKMLGSPPRCVRHMTMMTPIKENERCYWGPGRTVTVDFVDPKPESKLTDAVIKYAAAWEPFANIKFQFVERKKPSTADIHITFVNLPDGSNTGPRGLDGMSMCLEKSRFLRTTGPPEKRITEAEFGRVTIHEFGHALMADHEHQRPDTGIKWNMDGILKAFTELGRRTKSELCEDRVKGAIWGCDFSAHELIHSDITTVNNKLLAEHASPYDPLSIMHYPIPEGYTTNSPERVIPANMFLSKWDKAWIARYYPYPQRKIRNWNFTGTKINKPYKFSRGPASPSNVTLALAGLEVVEGEDPHTSMRPENHRSAGCNINLQMFDTKGRASASLLETASDDPAFQVGTFDATPNGHGKLNSDKEIEFTRPFFEPDPVVVVWLNSIHSKHGHDTRIRAWASEISTTGFKISIESSDDSYFHSASASWVAYPKDMPGTQTGNFTPTAVANTVKVPFTDDNFTTDSRVLAAVNQLDFSEGDKIIFTLVPSDIDEHGMNLKVDGHVGATYLALAQVKGPPESKKTK